MKPTEQANQRCKYVLTWILNMPSFIYSSCLTRHLDCKDIHMIVGKTWPGDAAQLPIRCRNFLSTGHATMKVQVVKQFRGMRWSARGSQDEEDATMQREVKASLITSTRQRAPWNFTRISHEPADSIDTTASPDIKRNSA